MFQWLLGRYCTACAALRFSDMKLRGLLFNSCVSPVVIAPALRPQLGKLCHSVVQIFLVHLPEQNVGREGQRFLTAAHYAE